MAGRAVDGGHILVFRQRDLADLNRHMPREFIDQWMRTACERIGATLKRMHVASPLLARLNGSDFALLLPGCAAPQAMMVAEQVRADLHASRIPVGEGHLCRWAQAMTDYGHGNQAGPVLARLDFGLMRAESAGNDQVVIAGATDMQSSLGVRRTRLEGRHTCPPWKSTASNWPPNACWPRTAARSAPRPC